MIDQKSEPLFRRSSGVDRSASRDMIAAIKVKALLDFSEDNPEFQAELCANAAEAAKQRGDLLPHALVVLPEMFATGFDMDVERAAATGGR